jgi:hypothetical protein
VGKGYDFNITVRVANLGGYQETFNLTLYATLFIAQQNVTLQIASQNVTLESGYYANITFVVNTADYPYSNYTLSAYAWPVPSETETEDNTLIRGWICITIPGDVTGDIWVDMQDISILIDVFMANPEGPRWNPNCDVNNDLTIDMADISIAIDHFMQT